MPSQALDLQIAGVLHAVAGLENDERLVEEFVHNTCGVLTSRVTGYEVTRHQISEANRLLFAIISNDKLINWLKNYEQKPA